jgi:hypothetical protein
MMPTQRYTIRDDDVAQLLALVDNDEERMLEPDERRHYTLDDLRKARLRNARIRRALHLKED